MFLSLNYSYVSGGFYFNQGAPASATNFSVQFVDGTGVILYQLDCGVNGTLDLSLNCTNRNVVTRSSPLPNYFAATRDVVLYWKAPVYCTNC